MSEAMIQAVAERLLMGWRTGRRQPLEGLALPNPETAYAVQRRVAGTLGWFDGGRPTAWKLGGAPGGLVSAAAVPADAIHSSGWHVPAGYAVGLGIEGELAVRLGRDLSEAPDPAELHAAIDAWLPVIELCDTRLERGADADPLLRLADQQLNRALILGAPVKPAAPLTWRTQPVTLEVEGNVRLAATGSHPFLEPLANLPWLARHAALQGTPLRAGDIIATGSWTNILWASPGQRVDVRFPGIGEVTLFT